MTNKYLLKTIVLIVCLVGIGNLSQAQPMSSQAIDALVQRSMKTFDVPGIAVGIIKDGQVVDKLVGAQPKSNFVKKIEQHK